MEKAAIVIQAIARKSISIAAEATPQLTQALSHSKGRAKCETIRTLGCIGDRALVARPQLEAILAEDKDENSQFYAIHAAVALAKISPLEMRNVVVEALIARLKDSRPWVRWNAADALGKCGVKSEQVRIALVKSLSDRHVGVRVMAADALCRIGYDPDNDLIHVLIQAMREDGRSIYDKPPYLSEWLLSSKTVAVGTTRFVAKKTKRLPDELKMALLSCLNDDNPDVRLVSIRMIQRIGLDDSLTVVAIQKAIDHETVQPNHDEAKSLLSEIAKR
jgi:HEAT repeat protein